MSATSKATARRASSQLSTCKLRSPENLPDVVVTWRDHRLVSICWAMTKTVTRVALSAGTRLPSIARISASVASAPGQASGPCQVNSTGNAGNSVTWPQAAEETESQPLKSRLHRTSWLYPISTECGTTPLSGSRSGLAIAPNCSEWPFALSGRMQCELSPREVLRGNASASRWESHPRAVATLS